MARLFTPRIRACDRKHNRLLLSQERPRRLKPQPPPRKTTTRTMISRVEVDMIRSREVRNFNRDIAATLQSLQDGTPSSQNL
jgi:hypothetical protein